MTARTILLAMLGIALLAGTADAQGRPRPDGRISGKRFQANKTFGLGLELGEPTGLTGKYFLTADRAIDFGVGDIYHYFDRSGLHVYGDYLIHPVSLVSTEAFELPLYFGVGARFFEFDDHLADGTVNTALAFGIRAPVGVAMDFNNVPIDVFFQLVPVLDFFSNYAAHTVFVDIDASIGVRYWFN